MPCGQQVAPVGNIEVGINVARANDLGRVREQDGDLRLAAVHVVVISPEILAAYSRAIAGNPCAGNPYED